MFKSIEDCFDTSILLGIQIERNIHSMQYSPFTAYEEILLSLLCISIKSKLRSFFYLKEYQYFSVQTFDFPKIIIQILRSRNIIDLISIISNTLPKNF